MVPIKQIDSIFVRTAVAGPAQERRSRIRFPMILAARYTLFGTRLVTGLGTTIDISSSGVLMTAEQELASGTRLNLLLDWPIHLNATCSLVLQIEGQIVRSDKDHIAVRFLRQHLRTRLRTNATRRSNDQGER